MGNYPSGNRSPGWNLKYDEHISEQEANMLQHLSIHRVTRCRKEIHQPAESAFACDHCTEQDPIHPDGIVRMPKAYFLCKKCLLLLESHKLQFVYEVKIECNQCIWAEIQRIMQIDPYKFEDKMKPGTWGDPSPVKA